MLGRTVVFFLISLALGGTANAQSDCFCGEGAGEFFYSTAVEGEEQWLLLYPWEVRSIFPVYDMQSPGEAEVVACHVVVGLVDETVPSSDTYTLTYRDLIFYGRWMPRSEFEAELLAQRCLAPLS